MSRNFHFTTLAVFCAVVAPVSHVTAGVKYTDGDKFIEVGGQLQLQYHHENPNNGASTDDVFFRRLKLIAEGSVHKDWQGIIELDFGKAENNNEVSVQDAYYQYLGLKNMTLSFGNMDFPFSRELLTSSKRQQLVERTLVGDHNYGTPDKNIGIQLRGYNDSKTLGWTAAGTMASVDPDVSKLDFDSPVNANSDFNQGFMFGGRIDYYPFGYMKFAQGDFSKKTTATISIAAYSWNNDNDNNTYTGINPPSLTNADVDSVTGLEVSGALRMAGFSVDAEYNSFDADTIINNFTGGIYTKGSTTLTNAAIEGGYMFDNTIELVAGYQTQDADGYATAWNRKSAGVNWYIKEQDIKFQLTYRIGDNLNGVKNNDEDEVFLQGQFLF